MCYCVPVVVCGLRVYRKARTHTHALHKLTFMLVICGEKGVTGPYRVQCLLWDITGEHLLKKRNKFVLKKKKIPINRSKENDIRLTNRWPRIFRTRLVTSKKPKRFGS